MSDPTPAPAPDGPDCADPKRAMRARGLKLRKLAERRGYDARQASGAWRLFVMHAGDRQLVYRGDIDGAEHYLSTARPRWPYCE